MWGTPSIVYFATEPYSKEKQYPFNIPVVSYIKHYYSIYDHLHWNLVTGLNTAQFTHPLAVAFQGQAVLNKDVTQSS